MRRAAVLFVALLAAGVVGLAPAAGAATDAPDDEATLLQLTNDDRADAGLAPLADDQAAAGVARAWARTLADSGSLRHNPDLVAEVNASVTREWTRLGENVGRGPDVQKIEDAFMASSSHRANVLGAYNRVGIGAVRDENGGLWVAVVFLQGPPLRTAMAAADAEAFVAQQYRDFLGRDGDPAGVRYWASKLESGAASEAAVVESFLRSPEFDGLLAPVVRLVLGAFGGVPEQSTLQPMLDARRDGTSSDAIADELAASSRFADLDHRGYVDAIYRTALGRPADGPELDRWAGSSRGAVLLGVAATPEFVWTSYADVSTTMAYVGLLRRSPDAAGFTYWVGQLDAGRSVVDLLAGLLGSEEYRSRLA